MRQEEESEDVAPRYVTPPHFWDDVKTYVLILSRQGHSPKHIAKRLFEEPSFARINRRTGKVEPLRLRTGTVIKILREEEDFEYGRRMALRRRYG
jgi:hypothetical protein